MKISRNWLETYFDKPIPDADKLAELFTFHSFEVEGMEKVGDDDVLDVKVLPDRAHYALCHCGIALEVSVLTKQPFKANRVPNGPDATIEQKPAIRIEAPQFCRRYMGRYAEIPAVAPSNPHACTVLEAIGERAINAVVDATNIVMFDIGQPLHAFDADQIKGTIVVRAAKKGETIELLDSSAGTGRVIELLETDHVIADDLGPLAIAGVKGGKRAGISASTRRLMIESANFDPTAVRRTATRLDLRSESSKRYENEITPELASQAMNDVCALIAYNIKDAKYGPVVDEYPVKAKQTVFEFDPAYLAERLGVNVPLDEAKDILTRMRITVESVKSKVESGPLWHLTIPFNRLDLTIREDIVEEVGRVYGYDHIKGILPPVSKEPVRILPMFYLAEKIKNILVAQGFSEVSLYSLVEKGEIETAKPLARDKAFARKNLTDGMMACVEKNALNADLLGLDAVKVFEVGHVFSKNGESVKLAIGAAQIRKIKGFKSEQIVASAFEAITKELGCSASMPKPTVKGSHAVVEIDLNDFLKSYKAAFSYNELSFQPASANRYQKFSPFPFIVRDIAVFVPESVAADEVWQTIQKGIAAAKADTLLARHSLFDTFKKEGKVSYAFRLVFQSTERTLTDAEANGIMAAINAEIQKKSWEVR